MKKRIGLTHSGLIAAIVCLLAGAMYGGLLAHAMCWHCWLDKNITPQFVGLYVPPSPVLKYEHVLLCHKCRRYWRSGSPWKEPWDNAWSESNW